MKRRLICVAIFCSVVLAQPSGYSQTTPQTNSPAEPTKTVEPQVTQPVIVTATRTAATEESVGKSFSVISGDELKEDHDLSIIDSLRQLPGVRVQQLGGPGNFTSVRLRGLRNADTQLLVNGLPLRDASETQGSANGLFQEFRTDFLSQIDVVRGASSTLYGSDALAGSINLIPERPMGKPTLEAGFEGGTLSTYRQTYAVKGGEEKFSYLLGYGRTTSEGIDDHDDYDNNHYSVFLTSKPTDKVEVQFDFIGSDTRLDLNESPTLVGGKLVTGIDDPNDFRDSEFFFYGTHVKYQATDNWEHIFRFGAVDVNKEFVFKIDPDGSDFPSVSEFNGNTYNFEYQTNLQVNDRHLITFGYEHEREELEQITEDLGAKVKEEPDQYQNSWYLQDQMNFLDERLFVTGGVRLTDHETIGTDVSGEGSVAYLIKETKTKLHGHIGTGLRAPSLFELFGASTFGGFRTVFGSTALDPEKSLSWDIGVDQKFLGDKAEFGVTYFQDNIDDIIIFGPTGYINIDDADSRGIEASLKMQFTENLLGRAFYTFTDSEDFEGKATLGIPEHSWGLDMSYHFLKKFKLLVRGTYYDTHEFPVLVFFPAFSTEIVEADDYFKVDAVLSYQVNENIEAYIRAENLFDEEIVESGFEATPALVFGGIQIKL